MQYDNSKLIFSADAVTETTAWQTYRAITKGKTTFIADIEQGEDASTATTLEMETSVDGVAWVPVLSEYLTTDGDAAATAKTGAGPEIENDILPFLRTRLVLTGSTTASAKLWLVSDELIRAEAQS